MEKFSFCINNLKKTIKTWNNSKIVNGSQGKMFSHSSQKTK